LEFLLDFCGRFDCLFRQLASSCPDAPEEEGDNRYRYQNDGEGDRGRDFPTHLATPPSFFASMLGY
jgi:hypothetical protein